MAHVHIYDLKITIQFFLCVCGFFFLIKPCNTAEIWGSQSSKITVSQNVMLCSSLVNEKCVASIPEDNVAGSSAISVPIHTLHNIIFKQTLTFNVVNVTNKTKHNDRFDVLTVKLMKTQIFLVYSDSEDEDSLLL